MGDPFDGDSYKNVQWSYGTKIPFIQFYVGQEKCAAQQALLKFLICTIKSISSKDLINCNQLTNMQLLI